MTCGSRYSISCIFIIVCGCTHTILYPDPPTHTELQSVQDMKYFPEGTEIPSHCKVLGRFDVEREPLDPNLAMVTAKRRYEQANAVQFHASWMEGSALFGETVVSSYNALECRL